jgi:predicted transcriptional regulator
MSVELKTLKLRVTPETDVALEAVARAFGRDKAAVAREILHEWAAKKLHEHRVFHGLAQAEGLMGASAGTHRADEGTRGHDALGAPRVRGGGR